MRKQNRTCCIGRSIAAACLALLLCGVSAGQKIDIYERPVQVERSHDFDAKHYRITLEFDLDKKTFWGENRITLSPLRDGFPFCELDVVGLDVFAVEDDLNRELRFEQGEGSVTVFFEKAYNYGDSITFTVKYYGKDPKQGLFFDDERTSGPQMVSTVSWPENARYWIPCYDYPHDKVTNELIVTVKSPLKVLSNGRLVSIKENESGGMKTYYWSQEKPHSTYLFMLAIAPFTVIEDSLGDLPVNAWVYEKDAENAKWIFEKTPYMIDFFNRIYDYPYPWAKYAQVTSPRMGGGAENTSATTLGEGAIYDRRAEQDFSYERIIAHEIAHQWWGDLITLRTWSHTWLNESFGTYSDHLYTRFDKGEDEGAVDLLGKKNSYLREAHTRYIRPIVFDRYERAQQNFDSHTYPKGAAVLHMLRFVLGDKPFFRILSHFLHKHEFQAVDTHDFMIAVKDVTGQNMDWFFEQFLFKPGHMKLNVSYTWDQSTGQIKLKVDQVQDTSLGVPIYRIPVIIGITTDKGKVSKKVWLEEREETFTFDVESRPLMVRFDEGNYLLKEWTFTKTSNELLFQLNNDDVIGRMWAASQLEKFFDQIEVRDALRDSIRNDEFWAVRRDSLETLGKTLDPFFIPVFKAMSSDPNSKVRISALRILGEYKDTALIPFYKERFKKEDSYSAQAEALRSIGKCGVQSHLPFLEEAARVESPRNVIQRAASWALDRLKK